MRKIDRRIRRTHSLLMDSLVTLAMEKGYEAITIRDITERADVAYSTFFRHYREKDDLLAEVLKSVIHDLKVSISQNSGRSQEAEGKMLFQYVKDNADFFRLLFSSEGTSRVAHKMQDEIIRDVMKMHPMSNNPTIPLEIAVNHLIVTVMALIRWWLDHDMPYSVERMAEIYCHLSPLAAVSEYPA